MSFTFYLGTHQPSWLAEARVPLFVSAVRLRGRRTFPRAVAPWALDSGGFSELAARGVWTVGPAQYVAEVRRWRDEIGSLAWAAAQDWMCEPVMLAKTGLTVWAHQRNTVDNYGELRALAPEIPWAPVLQGWSTAEYLRHIDMYAAAGLDLRAAPVVGVGSICRRQAVDEVTAMLARLRADGYRVHAFGFKQTGLRRSAGSLASSDSMAWSYWARREAPLPGCTSHKNCANCLIYALDWRSRLLEGVGC